MSLIQVTDLTFSYPSSYDEVFSHANFQIDTRWKLGLIGRNGRGKTTLLRLLMGEYPYGGSIHSSVEFDYFPYPVPHPQHRAGEVLAALCPQAQPWQIAREISLLDVEEAALERPFSSLSQGEQTKLLLSALFLKEGHFLLIDEPTNHLDEEGRRKVAAYLKGKQGFLLVSHDRRFLDGCVDHILSLNRADIQVQKGNFSSWMENFQRQQMLEEKQQESLKKDIRRLEKAAQRSATWSQQAEKAKYQNGPVDRGYIGHKAAKMMKRSQVIKQRQQQAIQDKSALLKNQETVSSLKLSPLSFHSQRLAAFSQVQVQYGHTPVCPPVSFTLEQGDRVALVGKNGSGKTSLLRLLTDGAVPYVGEMHKASGLVISLVPQDASFLRGSLSRLIQEEGLDESLFKAILRKMDFARVQFEKNLEDLSQGQKKKVLLARSLCQQAHVYVWDEPLNYIDIYSRLQIEELIQQFAPTMLFVEHDQAFREKIATKKVFL